MSAAPRVRLRPELLEDLAEAFAWYEARSRGIGRDFTRTFFAAVARASRSPRSSREVYAGFRRVRLRRFPYSLYFRSDDEETVFFLLFHCKRDPKEMQRALSKRRSAD